MTDSRVRALVVDHNIEIVAADTTTIAQEAELRHIAGRVSAVALAKTMTAAILVGSRLRGDERLSLQFTMDGGIRGILVDTDAEGAVRGYTQLKVVGVVDAGPSHYSYGLGNHGTVTLIQSTAFHENARGSVSMTSFDIAGDIEYLLQTSQQIPSRLALAADYDDELRYSGGVLAQGMAGHDAATFERLGERFVSGEVVDWMRRLREPEEVVRTVADGAGVRIESRAAIAFRCRCSDAKVRALLRTLPIDELADLVSKNEAAHVTCNFCNRTFEVDVPSLRRMRDERM
jgi:molecular chaperone Hsp33